MICHLSPAFGLLNKAMRATDGYVLPHLKPGCFYAKKLPWILEANDEKKKLAEHKGKQGSDYQ
jgi:hypothetical protein